MSQDISCSRCKIKKVRCNKARPKCDKCEAIDAECIYLPRKARDKKKKSNELNDKDALPYILRRLDRLEKHCHLDSPAEEDEEVNAWSLRSDSLLPSDNNIEPTSPNVEVTAFSRLGDHGARSQQSLDLLYQLRYAGPNLVEDGTFTGELEAAIAEIENSDAILSGHCSTDPPQLPKETAKRWISLFFDTSKFEWFQCPLERDFISYIPDLLETRHVKLDNTCLIIYYNCILEGMAIDPDPMSERGALVQHLYRKCVSLAETWRGEVQNTYTDFYAAFLMISMSFEGGNVELAWEIFGIACRIAEDLGYFTIDGKTPVAHAGETIDESPEDQNRKRYEFWHLLRSDCLFRIFFGRPALIPKDSWAVNFPDTTLNGDDHDDSTRFIQIHFLASMRFTLVLMKYLDLEAAENISPVAEHDETLDNLTEEVKSIMSNWQAEDLVENTATTIDSWFCADILFNGYKILIVFQRAKKCNQQSIPPESVDIARACVTKMRSVVNSRSHMYWGISPILLHQFIPFLVLCSNIVGTQGRDSDTDLDLVTWVSSSLGIAAEDQEQPLPIRRMMKAMVSACQQIVQSQ